MASTTTSFIITNPLKTSSTSSTKVMMATKRFNTKNHNELHDIHPTSSSTTTDNNDDIIMTRRKMFGVTGIVTASSLLLPSISIAEEDTTPTETTGVMKPIGTDQSHPISIIGAGGKVGNLCTQILNKKGLYTRAITRSGRKTLTTDDDDDSSYVSYASGDVTNYEAIKQAVAGSSGVIFAASASGKKKGGDPEHVDYLGLYYTAKVST